jgi:UDP-glucose 4-epimerase
MRRALVTGGSGLLGRPLVKALLGAGVEVIVLSRQPVGPAGITLLAWDLTDPRPIPDQALEGVDCVFHLASHTGDGGDGEQGMGHQRLTLDGTARLLEAAARHGVGRMLFASSVRAAAPAGDYGRAKQAAEALLLAAPPPLTATVLRLPALYGDPQRGNIARLLRLIHRGRLPPLPETGNRRSLLHLQDAVAAFLALAEDPRAAGRRYTLTDGEAYSAARIDRAIRAALGRPPPRWVPPLGLWRLAARAGDRLGAWSGRELPLNTSALDRLLGDAWYDDALVRRELGLQTHWTLERALPEMAAAYLASAGSPPVAGTGR